MKERVAVLHGVNLNALGRRPAQHYGDLTLAQLEIQIERFAEAHGFTATFFQTNHEGEYVEELHRAHDFSDALILNPGAWTHYSWAIRDAVELCGLPSAEVHLSDVKQRESWRQLSVLEEVCDVTVSGRGPDGYDEALARLRKIVDRS